MDQLNIHDLLRRINVVGERAKVALCVYQIVRATIRIRRRPAEPEPEQPVRPNLVENDNRIAVHERNLLHLLGLLESYGDHCEGFMKNFPKWEPVRQENCALLKSTGKNLQYDHTACTITSVAANSVAAVGGATVLSALIFPPAAPFVACGWVASGLGAATAVTTTFVDTALVKKHVKKAQKITRKDEESYKLLGNWIKHTEEIKQAMTELLGFSIWKKMWDNLRDIKQIKDLLTDRLFYFTRLIEACVAFLPPDHALFLCVGINVSAAIITTIIAMIMFHHQTRSALKADMLFLGMARILTSSTELGRLIAESSTKAGAAVAKTLAKRAATGILAGIGVALDISMIVLNSMELSKEGMCAEATMIIRLSDLLEEERKVLSEVYQKMLIGRQ